MGRAFQYRIGGLPANEEAFIANFGSFLHDKWKILRIKDAVATDWEGSHTTSDDALNALTQSVLMVPPAIR
jgi:hypothetical protein